MVSKRVHWFCVSINLVPAIANIYFATVDEFLTSKLLHILAAGFGFCIIVLLFWAPFNFTRKRILNEVKGKLWR